MDSYKKVIAILKNTQDKTQNTILNIKYNIKTQNTILKLKKTRTIQILCFFKLKLIVYQNYCFKNKFLKITSQAWRIPWTV